MLCYFSVTMYLFLFLFNRNGDSNEESYNQGKKNGEQEQLNALFCTKCNKTALHDLISTQFLEPGKMESIYVAVKVIAKCVTLSS
jgi:hypothetical protein